MSASARVFLDITNSDVSSAAQIAASKLQHHFSRQVYTAGGTDVVDLTTYIHLAYAAGSIVSVQVRPLTAPTGGDKNYTVDVKKAADGSGSFSSVLSSVITVNSSSTSNTLQSGTLSGATYAAGSLIQVVIDAGGTTGSQGQGYVIEVYFQEFTS